MAHIALYRKWRPRTFDDVVDQQHIVQTLKHSVASGNIAHAYLFCGTRGTGKTSLAKIFANAVNCLNPQAGNPCGTCEICTALKEGGLMDIQEIDAASNNSVDNIRRMTDEAVFLPARTKYKVYIIDEVHMLSSGAFNALLKTLEEPPAHVIFILATTEVHRLPATITSRCQRFDFRRISNNYMIGRLEEIAQAEGIEIEAEALAEITNQADGALRDAVSLLDQCAGAIEGTVTAASVRQLVGVVDRSFLIRLATDLADRAIADLLEGIATVSREGKDLLRFTESLTGFYRDLMIVKATGPEAVDLVRLTADEFANMEQLAARYDQPDLVRLIRSLSQLISDLKWASNPRTLLEINLIGLSGCRADSAPTKACSPGRGGGNPADSRAVRQLSDQQTKVSPPPAAAAVAPESPAAVTAEPLTAAIPPKPSAAAPRHPDDPADPRQTKAPAGSRRPADNPAAGPIEPSTSPSPELPATGPTAEPAPRTQAVSAADSTGTPAASKAVTEPESVEPKYTEPERKTDETIKPAEATNPPPSGAIAAGIPKSAPAHPDPAETTGPPLVSPDEPITARSDLWQKTLVNLQESDAFIYCFAISGQVSGTGAEVHLNFPETGQQNYSILTEQRGYRPLKEALKKANNGVAIDIKISLNGKLEPEPEHIVPDTDWLVTLQEKARELGIPVNRKEK